MVNEIEVIFFDLDDTLLYSNMDSIETGFLQHYFGLLAEYASPDIDPQRLISALMAAIQVMQQNQDPDVTNEHAFAPVFAARLDRPWEELEPFFARFYRDHFPSLRAHTKPHPDARHVVKACQAAGYRLGVATNPVFPATAIEQRMAWAGVEDIPFELVTTYENMHACKPFPAYYQEIADRMQVSPQVCLMVGNDLERDIAPAQQVGMHTFLVDQWLIGEYPQVRADGRGKLADLVSWVQDRTK